MHLVKVRIYLMKEFICSGQIMEGLPGIIFFISTQILMVRVVMFRRHILIGGITALIFPKQHGVQTFRSDGSNKQVPQQISTTGV